MGIEIQTFKRFRDAVGVVAPLRHFGILDPLSSSSRLTTDVAADGGCAALPGGGLQLHPTTCSCTQLTAAPTTTTTTYSQLHHHHHHNKRPRLAAHRVCPVLLSYEEYLQDKPLSSETRLLSTLLLRCSYLENLGETRPSRMVTRPDSLPHSCTADD